MIELWKNGYITGFYWFYNGSNMGVPKGLITLVHIGDLPVFYSKKNKKESLEPRSHIETNTHAPAARAQARPRRMAHAPGGLNSGFTVDFKK